LNFITKKGFTFIELVICFAILGFMLLSAFEMFASAYFANADVVNEISSRQSKLALIERLNNKIREAAAVYSEGFYIMIPTVDGTYSADVGTETIAVLIPKFDNSGNLIQPGPNQTTFTGVAFTILPKFDWDGSSTQDYALIETNYEVNLNISNSNSLKISDTLPTNWSLGQSYLLAENLKPAILTKAGTNQFDLENNIVKYSFVPDSKALYFASESGTVTKDDSMFLNTVTFRNLKN